MRSYLWKILVLFLIIIQDPVSASMRVGTVKSWLDTAHADARETVYQAPSKEDVDAFRSVISLILTDCRTGIGRRINQYSDQLASLGFRLILTRDARRQPVIAIFDAPGHIRGSGFYAIRERTEQSGPMLLQTPHGTSDLYTKDIGNMMFDSNRIDAFFSSTMRRNQVSSSGSAAVDSDLAHLSNSFFQAATEAFVTANPNSMIVQIHGFVAPGNDPDREFDIILSEGKQPDVPDPFIAAVQGIFVREMKPYRTGVYGWSTDVLGATTNEQGICVNTHPGAQFLHIELSAPLRKTLSGSRVMSKKFSHCLKKARRRYVQDL